MDKVKAMKSKTRYPSVMSRFEFEIGNGQYSDRKIKVWKIENRDAVATFNALKKRLNGEYCSFDSVKVPMLETYGYWEKTPHYNILFSGGFDSLSLAIRHLEKGEAICPFFIIFDPKELPFAKLSISILQHLYGEEKVGSLNILFSEVAGDFSTTETRFAQQPFAAFFASFISEAYLKCAIATEVAYCMNDDALSYLEELKGIYNSSMAAKLHRLYVPLEFPQIKYTHEENSELVHRLERNRHVIFPVYQWDACERSADAFMTKTHTWFMIRPNGMFEDNAKANKLVTEMTESYIIRVDSQNILEKDKKIVEDCIGGNNGTRAIEVCDPTPVSGS